MVSQMPKAVQSSAPSKLRVKEWMCSSWRETSCPWAWSSAAPFSASSASQRRTSAPLVRAS